MKAYQVVRDPQTGEEILETGLDGSLMLECPMLNKGSAFTEAERHELGLLGLLPPHVASMDEQLARTYENYQQKTSAQERHIFLTSLQDRNETLFYRLLSEHIAEMLPMVYTPVIGMTAQHYSHIYRRPRGLYIPFPQRDSIEAMLRNAPYDDVRAIVVTDGERVVGLGDLGIGGMGIPVGKLTLYSLCAGIHPATTLPIHLDAGTDNQALLDDPLYLGWRHERVRGPEYDAFVDAFVAAVQRVFPRALLQWEDFAKHNARRLLDRYRDQVCSFNDDIQGSGAAALAGLLAALRRSGGRLRDQRVVIAGAGALGLGICDMLVAAMVAEGVPAGEAKAAIWPTDSHGPVHDGRQDLEPGKRAYAQTLDRAVAFHLARPSGTTLLDVVRQVRPTILIGASAQPGLFTEPIVREIAARVERPIIFPLSSPASRCEATPLQLLSWTDGRALIASSNPLPELVFQGQPAQIGQCSSVMIFPGLALGTIAGAAPRVTDGMLVAAARALSQLAPAHSELSTALYPPITQVRRVARQVALAVAAEVQRGAPEPASPSEIARRVDAAMWAPSYGRIRRV
jgi:malate dehydrogenase (oxaloacetate-decarboxylating)